MADLSSDIETAATEPSSATIDGNTVTQRRIKDVIEADRYLASKTAGSRAHLGLRFTKVVAPGI